MYFHRAPASDWSISRSLARSQRKTDRFGELQSSPPTGRKGYPHGTSACRQSVSSRQATSRHNAEPRSGSLSSRTANKERSPRVQTSDLTHFGSSQLWVSFPCASFGEEKRFNNLLIQPHGDCVQHLPARALLSTQEDATGLQEKGRSCTYPGRDHQGP